MTLQQLKYQVANLVKQRDLLLAKVDLIELILKNIVDTKDFIGPQKAQKYLDYLALDDLTQEQVDAVIRWENV